MNVILPGFHPMMSAHDYYADPCKEPSLTQSIAKILLERSPAHARLAHPRLSPVAEREPEDYVAARVIGTAAHKLLLKRGRELVLADFLDWRSKAAKEFRGEAETSDLIPILSHHYDRAEAMVAAARVQLDAIGWTEAFRVGNAEQVIIAKDGPTWLRSLVDWFSCTTLLYDFKTSGASLAPHLIGRKAEADGWHIQAAMQDRILDILDPHHAGQRVFRFVAQENQPPYALVGVELDEHWMCMGRKQVDAAVTVWRRCMASGEWPAYPAFPITPEYPGYRETAWLDREQSEPQFAADHLMAG